MSGLVLTVTTAGRAAIVNAQHNGTNTVLVASVSVTSTAFVASASLASIPNEIKRIASIAGGATAPDTIHITINDNTADTYAVKGIGIYLADGTLFACYGQSTVLFEKASQATLLVSADVQFADVNAQSIIFGDANFQLNQATISAYGIVKLGSDADAIAGTDPALVVTPRGLAAALDNRLGAGAASTFVKSMLTAATSAAFRLLLGIKGAASFDPGVGGGLDADMLDGQHGAYYASNASVTSGLAGKQASLGFTPVQQGTGIGQLANGIKIGWSGSGLKATVDATDLGMFAFQPWVATNYASLASPALTGMPSAPTAAVGTNTTQIANTAYVMAAVNALISGAPGALDTLKELADAMGDDPHFAATVMNALAGKQPNLGFSPVQQGTGAGQTTNVIKIGWSAASKVKVTVDATDMGNIALENWVSSTFMVPSGQYNAQNFQLKSGAPPSMAYISASGNDRNTSLQISNGANNSASAMMSFIREGLFGCHFGMDTDNALKVGGWSFGPVAYRVVHEGLQTVNLPGILNVIGSITTTQDVVASQNFIANSANVVLATAGPGTVYFRPNGPNSAAGQARIDTSGNLILSGNAQATYLGAGVFPSYPLDVMAAQNGRVLIRASGQNATLDFVNASNNAFGPGAITASQFSFNVGPATFNGQVNANGQMVANGGFQVGSSKRIKTNIRAIGYGLADLLKIEVKRWRYKKRFNPDGRVRLGVIAEQLKRVVPEAVFENADGPTTVDYMQLIPVLIASIQELTARLRKIEAVHA